jgi:hypothetical protein
LLLLRGHYIKSLYFCGKFGRDHHTCSLLVAHQNDAELRYFYILLLLLSQGKCSIGYKTYGTSLSRGHYSYGSFFLPGLPVLQDLDTPLDNYFEPDKVDGIPTQPLEQPSFLKDKLFSSAISDKKCLVEDNENKEPLKNLFEVSMCMLCI